MIPIKGRRSKNVSTNIESVLGEIAKKLSSYRSIKKGVILIRTKKTRGGEYTLESSEKGTRLVKRSTIKIPPLIEIIGDVGRIESILAGKKDARAQFLAGGLRVRGDLRYFSNLALELGILKEPL